MFPSTIEAFYQFETNASKLAPEYTQLAEQIAQEPDAVVPVYLDGAIYKQKIKNDGRIYDIKFEKMVYSQIVLVDRENPFRTEFDEFDDRYLFLGSTAIQIVRRHDIVSVNTRTFEDHLISSAAIKLAEIETECAYGEERLYQYNFPSTLPEWADMDPESASTVLVGWDSVENIGIEHLIKSTSAEQFAAISVSLSPVARQLVLQHLGVDFDPQIAQEIEFATSVVKDMAEIIGKKYGVAEPKLR